MLSGQLNKIGNVMLRNKLLPVLFLIFMPILVQAREVRSLWALPWNISTRDKVDELVRDAIDNSINEILAEVRYRSDAMYVPNKRNSTYNNPEPQSHALRDGDFDPLEYLLEQAHMNAIDVQAWVCVYVATPTHNELLQQNYIYQNHRNWLMTDAYGSVMNGKNYNGYFIDPGITAVKNHLLNVFLDIVSNYPTLDGIHLDYVRYPSANYGYSAESKRRFNEVGKERKLTWNEWRISQVTDLVSSLKEQVQLINPRMMVTAAVMANVYEARNDYAQDWVSWVNNGLVDRVYPMAYAKDYYNFYNTVSDIYDSVPTEDTVIGLRAWQEYYPRMDYSLSRIVEKAKLCRQLGFKGIALFSYEGIKQSGFFPELTNALFDWKFFDLDYSDEDRFITQITSRYLYQVPSDTTCYSLVDNQVRSVRWYENDESPSNATKPQTYCDDISVQNGEYYISFFFNYDSRWKWEILATDGSVFFQKTSAYPWGYYVDVWDGSSKEGKEITPGIYTLRISDSKGRLISEKRFIAS